MRILLLSTSFPPFADSHLIRLKMLFQELKPPDFELTVVAPGNATVPIAPFPHGNATRTSAPPIIAALERVKARGWHRCAWLISNVGYRLAVPDAFGGWERIAADAADALPPFDVIVSSSGSATAHVAADALRRRRRVPWLAEYGDPWHLVDRIHRPWVAPYSAFTERRVLRNASRVVFTTEATRAAYERWLGKSLPPAVVLPYGFARADLQCGQAREGSGPVTFAHVGTAHRGSRNLLPFIDALADFQERTDRDAAGLAIVGGHSVAFDRRAAQRGVAHARFEQVVPYNAALEAMAGCDVLVVIGNKVGLQIPGKVFLVIGSPKPVLYIRQQPEAEDPAVAMFGHLPGVVVAPNDRRALFSAITTLVRDIDFYRKAARDRAGSEEVAHYEATAISRQFRCVLEQVVSGVA